MRPVAYGMASGSQTQDATGKSELVEDELAATASAKATHIVRSRLKAAVQGLRGTMERMRPLSIGPVSAPGGLS